MTAAGRGRAMAELPEKIRMLPAGERGLVIEMGKVISPRINAAVQRLAGRLSRESLEGVVDIVPTYCSLFVHFDPLRLSRSRLSQVVARLADFASEPDHAGDEVVRMVRVPVCYGGEYGPDLDQLARVHALTREEVVTIHSSRPYRVYMLGFTPGFPYLGGMSARIATPRLEEPRTRVPRGSVGIAGAQTGIYPLESPGGWRLIGRTPLRPFRPEAAHPFLFAAGDYVQFEAVLPGEYLKLERQVEAGSYVPDLLTVSRERLEYDQGR